MTTKSTNAFAFESAYRWNPIRFAYRYSASLIEQQIGFEKSARSRKVSVFPVLG